MREKNRQRKFSNVLLQWYSRRGRVLPWRNISDPYRILVSEIMLQQTQVSRVLMKYPAFLRRFPTLYSLARAKQRDVVIAWRGMGYNNRATRLHKLARQVLSAHGGRIPADANALLSLPGIGRYTAHALLASAFRKRVPVVDVNVRRVLLRVFWRMSTVADLCTEDTIWRRAETLLPKQKAYAFNQALMDLGAMVCIARRPRCGECPVAEFCVSRSILQRQARAIPRRVPRRDRPPNRIFRGRIIEELRDGSMSLPVGELRRRVCGPGRNGSSAWFASLLSGLERDGLIRMRQNGTARTTRVSLA